MDTTCMDINLGTLSMTIKRKSHIHLGLVVLNLQLMLYLDNLTVNVLLSILYAISVCGTYGFMVCLRSWIWLADSV